LRTALLQSKIEIITLFVLEGWVRGFFEAGEFGLSAHHFVFLLAARAGGAMFHLQRLWKSRMRRPFCSFQKVSTNCRTILRNLLEHKICVMIFSSSLSETFFFNPRRIQRDNINLQRC
jgi:hypothetical protein